MLNEILLYLGKDERMSFPKNSVKFLKKGINHVKDLVMEKRRNAKSVNEREGDESDRFGYNHHERMDEAEELDR